MKLSVSLSDGDVAFIDVYAEQTGATSRSAVLKYAVDQLRARELQDNYAEAWSEWESTGDARDWDTATTSDTADL